MTSLRLRILAESGLRSINPRQEAIWSGGYTRTKRVVVNSIIPFCADYPLHIDYNNKKKKKEKHTNLITFIPPIFHFII